MTNAQRFAQQSALCLKVRRAFIHGRTPSPPKTNLLSPASHLFVKSGGRKDKIGHASVEEVEARYKIICLPLSKRVVRDSQIHGAEEQGGSPSIGYEVDAFGGLLLVDATAERT